MLDFGALPPEINSARMYAGPRSGPMVAAAVAWGAVADQLDLFATGCFSVLAELQGEGWSGGASAQMASAVAPYLAWATTTATRAKQTAMQAHAAAAAFETAFAATVPPELVAANRAEAATLVATNIFGQNTMGIAATDATYAEMWVQDAAAMYDYAASSSVATRLTPFSTSPHITNAAAESAQAAAVTHANISSAAGHARRAVSQLMSTVPQQLQLLSATSPGHSTLRAAILSVIGAFNTLTGPASVALSLTRTVTSAGSFVLAAGKSGADVAAAAPQAVLVGSKTVDVPGAGAVRASVGEATSVGKLSAPQSWAAAAPVAGPASEPQWLSDTELEVAPSWEELPPASMLSGGPTAGIGPITGVVGRPTVNSVLRVGPRRFKMPRPTLGG